MKTIMKISAIVFMVWALTFIVFARADSIKTGSPQDEFEKSEPVQERPRRVAPPPQEEVNPIPMDTDQIPLAEEDLVTTEFFYKPAGRRDPFIDLLRGKNISNIKREAKEGIAGLLTDELDLEGIILKRGKYIALFKGPDGKPYDVYVGDSVYDGEVIKIDMNTVYFKRFLTLALGGTKEKIITKSLIPEEEAEKK